MSEELLNELDDAVGLPSKEKKYFKVKEKIREELNLLYDLTINDETTFAEKIQLLNKHAIVDKKLQKIK